MVAYEAENRFDISYYAQFAEHAFYEEFVSFTENKYYSWARYADEFQYRSGGESYHLLRSIK